MVKIPRNKKQRKADKENRTATNEGSVPENWPFCEVCKIYYKPSDKSHSSHGTGKAGW